MEECPELKQLECSIIWYDNLKIQKWLRKKINKHLARCVTCAINVMEK